MPTRVDSPNTLLGRVLERTNLQRALKQVRQNHGAPGIDGMTVEELPQYLKEHWPAIRQQLETGRYRPQPVRRVDIPKGNGKTRPLGIPTVLDRFIQQAVAQVISAQWDPHFHPHSYGFRPCRSAHQAVRHVQRAIRDGYDWVVDMDLENFFDRINHDRLMARLKGRTTDAIVLHGCLAPQRRRSPGSTLYRCAAARGIRPHRTHRRNPPCKPRTKNAPSRCSTASSNWSWPAWCATRTTR
ncbi:reverse transcriptase domain-containing protein [Dyella sp. KRB-257]|uniref:reverse transcriptase domain-containing protein n=1 Tax=Dyella sp. KRB-257 TaxID=3400915 RepID=UPI003C0956C7